MLDSDFPSLVVVGNLADGSEGVAAVVRSLPDDFPAPVIIAQHLDLEHQSRLVDILASDAKLPVEPITGRHRLVAGTIYVVAQDTSIEITGNDVRVIEDGDSPGFSIDLLLESAAEAFNEHLIAVILAGIGSDGISGARAVKEHRGMVIVEDPATSDYPDMALPPTQFDLAADPDSIGPLLHDLLTRKYQIESPAEDDVLQDLLAQVNSRAGIDFSAYKRPTLMRRIQRRMILTDNLTLAGYLDYLNDHPEEYETLASSFLINVTEFFRDPEQCEYLLNGGLQPLLDEAARSGSLRIWSAGCSTGEEAYTLAIIVRECMGDDYPGVNVRIFGTDIDEPAISYARRGMYPASSLQNLPETLVARYFASIDGYYEVQDSIRSMVVFGQHDLGHRSPFPRIDLVVCRNVLIYFSPELQRRALRLFAYSLRRGGLLMLGRSETIDPLPEFFLPQDAGLKVFQRHGEQVLIPPRHAHGADRPEPVHRAVHKIQAATAHRRPRREAASSTNDGVDYERALHALGIGVLIVAPQYAIQFMNPIAARHLGIHGMTLDEDLMHVVQNVSLSELRDAVDSALRGQPDTRTFEIDAATGTAIDRRYIELTCLPLSDDGSAAGALIQTVDVAALEQARQEMAEMREQIQRQIQMYRNLETANERLTELNTRLRARNHDLQIANEEFQAAAEEVETLNEELQATNEELETLNEELHATIEELNTSNEDLQIRTRELEILAEEREEQRQQSETERARLQAVLRSMDDAVLLVDEDGQTVLANAAFSDWFGADGSELLPEDDNGNTLPQDSWPQVRAAAGESFTMRFSLVKDGERWTLEATGRPVSGESGGVVVFRRIAGG